MITNGGFLKAGLNEGYTFAMRCVYRVREAAPARTITTVTASSIGGAPGYAYNAAGYGPLYAAVSESGKHTRKMVKKLLCFSLFISIFSLVITSCAPISKITIINKYSSPVLLDCSTNFIEYNGIYENMEGIQYCYVTNKNNKKNIYFLAKPLILKPDKRIDILRAITTDIIYDLGYGDWKIENDEKVEQIINAIDNVFSQINIYSENGQTLLADKAYFLKPEIIDVKYSSLPTALNIELKFTSESDL